MAKPLIIPAFQLVEAFLRENPGATYHEIAKATGLKYNTAKAAAVEVRQETGLPSRRDVTAGDHWSIGAMKARVAVIGQQIRRLSEEKDRLGAMIAAAEVVEKHYGRK